MGTLGEERDPKLWPLYGTSWLTTFGDHVMRQILVVHVMARTREVFGLDSAMFLAWSVLILLMPFVLMAPLSGWLSDRFQARSVIRISQVCGVVIMLSSGWAIASGEFELACILLTLKGVQSSFMGSAKYVALTQVMCDEERLMRGNAWLESLTLSSIIMGTMGGMFMGELMWDFSRDLRPVVMIATLGTPAMLGLVMSMWLPSGSVRGELKGGELVGKKPGLLGELRREEGPFLSAMGVAWFWFIGAALFTLGPMFVGRVFEGDSQGFLFLFVVFGVGLIVGTWLCRWMAKGRIELGLVPFASLGMSVLLVDLCVMGYPDELLRPETFWMSFTGIRIFVDLCGLACFGGVFTLPLQSFVHRSLDQRVIARATAGMNWLSAVGMCLAGVLVVAMLTQGVDVKWVFLTLAVMNFVVMLFVYHMLPRFVWSFMVWVLTQVMYRFTMKHRERIPMEGAAVISCNHPSFVDFMFVAAALSHRPPRFIMHHTFFKMPVVGWLFRDLDVIPIAPRSEDEDIMQEAFDEVARSLREGELVCLFPEGLVTFDGKLNAFRPGIEKIVERTPVPVIPLALKGLWGSFFSRDHEGQKAMREPFRRRFRSPIELIVGEAILPEEFSAKLLGEVTARMGGWDAPREVGSREDLTMQDKSKSS